MLDAMSCDVVCLGNLYLWRRAPARSGKNKLRFPLDLYIKIPVMITVPSCQSYTGSIVNRHYALLRGRVTVSETDTTVVPPARGRERTTALLDRVTVEHMRNDAARVPVGSQVRIRQARQIFARWPGEVYVKAVLA